MRFVFMIYVARSGSTLMAHQLAQSSPSVLVLPEFQLPHMLLAEGEARVRAMSSDRLASLIKDDPQAGKIGISPEAAEEIGRQCTGLGIRSVLEEAVRRYRERVGSTANTVIIKKGALLFYHRELAALFPDALFVHPYRDPRGVANSLIHTRDPYGARLWMARGDALVAAKYWRRFMQTIATMRLRFPDRLIETRYESFLHDPEGTLRMIASFVGVECISSGATAKLAVADAEASMHALAGQMPHGERSDAWQQELRDWQGVAVESSTIDELVARGYSPWYLARISRHARLDLLTIARAVSAVNTLSHSLTAARAYVRHPNRLVRRIRSFLTDRIV